MSKTVSAIAGDEEDFPEPPRLRRLRRMVMGLTAALILGILVIAGALVWRIATDRSGPAITAAEIVLPEGLEIIAIGGDGALLLVTTRAPDGRERIHAFAKSDGALVSEVDVARR
jgi:hypothetical protein